MGRWIDISMAVTDGLRSNHSRPGEEVKITYDVEPQDDPQGRKTVRRVNTRLHVGTHVDAPEHLIVGGRPISDFPLETFAGRAVVVDMYEKVPAGAIDAADLEAAIGQDVQPGDIVIVRTGWNSRYADPDFNSGTPYFRKDAADWFIDKQVKLVAIDFLSDPALPELQVDGVDAFKLRAFEAGIPVMTNADNLDQIRARIVTLYAFPLKLTPVEAAPARAVVWED